MFSQVSKKSLSARQSVNSSRIKIQATNMSATDNFTYP